MAKRVIIASIGKPIGEVQVGETSYPLIAPNGLVAQEIDAADGNFKLTDAYRLAGICIPTMPKEVLMQIGTDDVVAILNEVRGSILGITKEVLPGDPKAGTMVSP